MHSKNSRTWLFILVPVVMVAFRFMNPGAASAQQPVPGAGPAIYQRLAPVNLAGNWVSVVTEDWDIRMIPPAKGDFIGLPLNPAGQKAGNAWDAAKETPADVCKAYAAPALLRMPGRLKINWQDSGNTLQIEADAGQQTRLLHFTGEEPKGEAGRQGYSAAKWEYAGGFDPAAAAMAAAAPAAGEGRGPDGGGAAGGGRGGRPGRPGRGRATTAQGGALQVVTTHLKPGYLRKNGVPFSKEAVLTEYFNVHADPYGADWLIVTTIVHDPNYLLSDYITSTNFKREPDDSKWRPRPCATP